ncbi:GspE/PulE family protein [Sulfoacidibacillus thermotolerans]|uniref:Bacterial type II secretion system protein E domain-containing protein n=1 Tax=Sulfoacidibacillus thermotolerans TaxID=1765684 RepID=A0A2U3DC02_SULT2|nr:ATPase, T2SS/T4P/T4SS family [Sulfoacidibacillus thermotolerans]PWI58813.1 hypothetical protein BM613_01600 [Sulfoacidibacillus thermotolerans]
MSTGEYVDELIALAIRLQASDIHFDPFEERFLVRLRIHGRLVDIDQISGYEKWIHRQAVTRLKVLAKLSLVETRRPQDGYLHMKGNFGSCDLRISTLPTIQGERAVVRLIPGEVPDQTYVALGMTPLQAAQLQSVVNENAGMIVVTGRVGVGKSTTLHAVLADRSNCGNSILTIEDPVERRVSGYQQVEVDERIGLTFAQGLRAALRQDPDVLMVGEIRDEATAKIAVRAALTGHLLLSTMHAELGPQVVYRLIEFGIPIEYIRQVLKLVIWQTLHPIDCTICAGAGCSACKTLGVTGRKAEFSLFPSESIADFLCQPISHDVFKTPYTHEFSEIGGHADAKERSHVSRDRELTR